MSAMPRPDSFLRAIIGVGVSVCVLSGNAQELPQSAPDNMFPQWSHDGKRIVFTSDRDDDPEIYVMNTDGSGVRRLSFVQGRDAHPFFSRDGRTIVFQSPRENGEDTNIYSMDSDGSNVVRLTNLRGFAGVPVYSPDEKLINRQGATRHACHIDTKPVQTSLRTATDREVRRKSLPGRQWTAV